MNIKQNKKQNKKQSLQKESSRLFWQYLNKAGAPFKWNIRFTHIFCLNLPHRYNQLKTKYYMIWGSRSSVKLDQSCSNNKSASVLNCKRPQKGSYVFSQCKQQATRNYWKVRIIKCTRYMDKLRVQKLTCCSWQSSRCGSGTIRTFCCLIQFINIYRHDNILVFYMRSEKRSGRQATAKLRNDVLVAVHS